MVAPTLDQFFKETFTSIFKEWKKLLLVIIFISIIQSIIAIPSQNGEAYGVLYTVFSIIIGGVINVLLITIIANRLQKDKSTEKEELIQTTKKKLWPTITSHIAQQLVFLLIMLVAVVAIGLVMLAFLGAPFFEGVIKTLETCVAGACQPGLIENPAITVLIPTIALSFIIMILSAVMFIKQGTLISLTVPIAVLGKESWFAAVKKSRELVRPYFWEVLGRFFLIGLLVSIVTGFLMGFVAAVTLSFAFLNPEGVTTNYLATFLSVVFGFIGSTPYVAAMVVMYNYLKPKPAVKKTVKKKSVKTTKKTASKKSKN